MQTIENNILGECSVRVFYDLLDVTEQVDILHLMSPMPGSVVAYYIIIYVELFI